MLALRFILVSLLACLVVAQRVNRWPANQPQCTINNPCFNYMIVLRVSGPVPLTGNATQFRLHNEMAGFKRAAMILEGKKAAAKLKERYGVDATNLPDETYLAPSVQLADGITFNFVTVSPTLYMGAQKDKTQFFNIPTSVGWYNIDFSKDYVSRGTYRGTIPAGARVYYGSLVANTCPGQNRCDSVLSNKPKGQVFFRFYTKSYNQEFMPGPFSRIDSVLEHEEWGTGHAGGVIFTNHATGIASGNEVHTFPKNPRNYG